MSKTRSKAETQKNHICSQCGSAFNRPYRLKQHEKIHQNIKQFKCGEPNCNKSYTNKSHLDRHIYSVHMEPAVNMIYSCPQCRKVYVNRQNLKRHINNYHGRKTLFTCDVCNSTFEKKHQLTAHMYAHTFVKSFSCELCNCEFITLLDKKRHMKHHKSYSCDLCDMAFVQWSKYLKHKKMLHKEYTCDDCGRKFNKRVHIVRHTKIHNTCYTPTFFSCTYENCEKTYSRMHNLKQHIKMKHLKVKHECEICDAKLSTKANLQLHLITHSKPKTYIPPPTKKTGRKDRWDKGISKTSTALRIAGLLIDPEDEKIRGTLKVIADSATEQNSIAGSATEQNSTTGSATEQNSTTGSETEQDSIAGSATELNTIADSATEQNSTTGYATEHNSTTGSATEQNNIARSATNHNSISGSVTEQNGTTGSATEQNSTVGFVSDQNSEETMEVSVLKKHQIPLLEPMECYLDRNDYETQKRGIKDNQIPQIIEFTVS